MDILIDQEQSEQCGNLRSMLRQAGISSAILGSVPLQDIAKVHFPKDTGTKSQKNASEKFQKHVKLIENFREILSKEDCEIHFRWFQTHHPKKISDIINRLSKHAILGHYFIERLSLNNEESTGYVFLLREVTTLSKSIAEEIGRGITAGRYRQLCAGVDFGLGLSIGNDDLSMPIVEIGSPTIEHILQCFSHLFGRIGVADPVEAVIQSIIDNSLDAITGSKS